MNPIYSTIKKLLTKHKNQENTKDHIVRCFFAADKNIKPLKSSNRIPGKLFFPKDPAKTSIIMLLYNPEFSTQHAKSEDEYTLALTKNHIKGIKLIDTDEKTIAVKIKGEFHELWNKWTQSLEKKPFPGYLILQPINSNYYETFDLLLKRLKLIK